MFPVADLSASTVSAVVANIGELSCVSVLIDLNNLHKNIKRVSPDYKRQEKVAESILGAMCHHNKPHKMTHDPLGWYFRQWCDTSFSLCTSWLRPKIHLSLLTLMSHRFVWEKNKIEERTPAGSYTTAWHKRKVSWLFRAAVRFFTDNLYFFIKATNL